MSTYGPVCTETLKIFEKMAELMASKYLGGLNSVC